MFDYDEEQMTMVYQGLGELSLALTIMAAMQPDLREEMMTCVESNLALRTAIEDLIVKNSTGDLDG